MRPVLVRLAIFIACAASSARYVGCDASRTNAAFVDTDSDGLSDIDERVVYGTPPILPDTDGDGKSDHEEIVSYAFDPTNAPLRFNPRVADLPLLEVQLVSAPRVTISITETIGEVRTFETTRRFEEAIGVSFGFGSTFGRELSFGRTFTDSALFEQVFEESTSVSVGSSGGSASGGVPAEQDAGVLPSPIPGDVAGPSPVTFTITDGVATAFRRGFSRSSSFTASTEVTFSFTEQETRTFLEALELAGAYSQSHEITASGGSIRLLVLLANRGSLAFQVKNLELAASMRAANGTETPIGNLHIDLQPLNQYEPYSIAEGEQAGPVNFVRELLGLQLISARLRNINALVIRLGVYELADETGKPYAFDTTAVGARTATLTVDYSGRRPPKRYLVATSFNPALPGVSVRRAMEEILHMPFECTAEQGLTSFRDVAMTDEGSGRWSMHQRHSDGVDLVITSYRADVAPYDCERILLRAGDVLRIVWEP